MHFPRKKTTSYKCLRSNCDWIFWFCRCCTFDDFCRPKNAFQIFKEVYWPTATEKAVHMCILKNWRPGQRKNIPKSAMTCKRTKFGISLSTNIIPAYVLFYLIYTLCGNVSMFVIVAVRILAWWFWVHCSLWVRKRGVLLSERHHLYHRVDMILRA